MMGKSQKTIGVVFSYLSQVINILSGLIYTPIMLRLLGQSEYGLYQLVNSTVAYLGLFSLGFNAAYIRYYSIAREESEKRVREINGMFMTIFIVMSCVCLATGTVMVLNITSVFGKGLTVDEYEKATVLMILLVIAMAFTFPSTVFNCNISANEKFGVQKAVDCLQGIANPFLCLPLLIAGYGSVAVVLISVVLTISRFVFNFIYCVKKLGMRFSFRNFDLQLFRSLSTFTFFIFLNQIIDQVNWSLDKFLLGRFIGVSAVAIYGIGAQINTMYISFANSISNVFIPEVNRLVVEKKGNQELSYLFSKIGRLQFFIIWLIYSGFLIYGKQFVKLWAGIGYEDAYYVAIILMTPMIIPLIQSIGIEIQRAKNKHQVRSIVYFLLAIGNVGISIPLIKRFGVIGASLGTGIALILGACVFMNFYYQNALDIDIISFWKSILKIFPAMLISIVPAIAIKAWLPVESFSSLIINIVMYSCIYIVAIYFIGMNTYEKNYVKEVLNKVISIIKR